MECVVDLYTAVPGMSSIAYTVRESREGKGVGGAVAL